MRLELGARLNEWILLTAAAAGTGVLHTLIGPDHYVPFVALSKARAWSKSKTLWITFLCGLGHVASSVFIGFIGLAVGSALFTIEGIEALRGEIAAWLLLGFGLAYLSWGLHLAWKNRPHTHLHQHDDGEWHAHAHQHAEEHLHPHEQSSKSLTIWVLFIVFVFGPCEALIPLFMYPAAMGSWWLVLSVTLAFGLATVATMLALVFTLSFGFEQIRLGALARYGHALAGLLITACGAAIHLGL